MWDFLVMAAWGISAAVFLWLVYDFFKVNRDHDESLLLSSREGVDELFADHKAKGAKKP